MEAEAFTTVVVFLVLTHLSFAVVHLLIQKSMHDRMLDATSEFQDGMSKIAELGFIHMKSATVEDAVQATAYVQQQDLLLKQMEQSVEEELEAAADRGKPVGVRSSNGRVYPFTTPPSRETLERLGDRVVREYDDDAKKLANGHGQPL